ncbi:MULTISPECIES: mandelate racemase/muconate lactonizing enzyme family protein [unclassified Paraflavitalea]|uniref:mandelate racemase/muconate lactonizing enzyme family protein n=1 Tax=unclassified Paraflavitalea TaxID=2798305 RepID=UPI003D3353B2
MISHVQTYNLAFAHPFTISKGTKTHQPGVFIKLDNRGIGGYGEAPAIAYYNITAEKMLEDWQRKRMFFDKFAFTEPERYWHYLHHLIPNNPFLVSAFDMAAWDMFGKFRRQPLYQILGLDIKNRPLTDYTIGIDTPEAMVAKIKETPWPIYKIKVGTSDDIPRLQAMRAATDARIRVDANAGWTIDQAIELLPILEELKVELIEQPLAKDDWEGMKKLYKLSRIPLIADEACVFESDVEKMVGHFHGINIKLTKCSGITPAIRMIKDARSKDLSVMLGCMNESSIGSAALVHLSPMVDYLDADGPLLLKEDLASGLIYRDGVIELSDKPGLGVDIAQNQ